jgi:hypothetical protein
MGILDTFKTPKSTELKNGSEFAPKYYADDKAVPKSILASEQSPLHFNPNNPGKEGYSLNGNGEADVTKLYNEYDDGESNALPTPTVLEDLKDPTNTFTPTYRSDKKYETNHPEFTPKS